MSKPTAVPNAWDDDWEISADKPKPPEPAPLPAPKLTKAQRKAQHLEQQAQLWNSAENPDRFHWLESQGVVPLKQEFKPQVKLLSRKPNAMTPAAGAGGPNDDEDSDEESAKRKQQEFEERQKRAQLEREEKQRRYAEARERIMGSPKTTVAPAVAQPSTAGTFFSRDSSRGRDGGQRSRGSNRKGGSARSSQPTSSTDQSPSRQVANGEKKMLFDPDDITRRMVKRDSPVSTPREDCPIRQPRGPDKSGRGGFGFIARGGKAGV